MTETRISARAIIFIDGKLVLIRRVRHGREYWVIPGGGVEEGETVEDAVRREAKEEIGIDVRVGDFVMEARKTWEGRPSVHRFFLCEYVSGVVGTGTQLASAGSEHETHEVTLVPREKFASLDIVPEEFKEYLLQM